MKKIYYVRHGESQANVDGIIAGSEHEAPLTEKGKDQARKAGQELKDKKIELIVSSPMERTRDTATIIAKEIGYDPAKIIDQKLFIELRSGPYSGKTFALRDEHLAQGKLLPGVESSESVHARIKEAFEWLRGLDQQSIVIVSHGGTGRMVKTIVEELPPENFLHVERMGNSAVYEFELEETV